MSHTIIDYLKQAKLEEIELILKNDSVNFFQDRSFLKNTILLNDISKFKLFYNDKKAKEMQSDITLLNEAIITNSNEITKYLSSQKSIVNYQNRTKNNVLLNMQEDNLYILETILSSELLFNEKEIIELTMFLAESSFINSFSFIINNPIYSFVFNSSKLWVSLCKVDLSILEIYTENKNFKYLNSKLICDCYIKNDINKTFFLSNFDEVSNDFITFLINKRNKKRYSSNQDYEKIFKKLLTSPNLITKFTKKNIKNLNDQEDKDNVIKAQQVFKIENF
jgi:hypothetical protein